MTKTFNFQDYLKTHGYTARNHVKTDYYVEYFRNEITIGISGNLMDIDFVGIDKTDSTHKIDYVDIPKTESQANLLVLELIPRSLGLVRVLDAEFKRFSENVRMR